MTIHILPIEPIEKRYSKDWIEWFKDYKKFLKDDKTLGNISIIEGDLIEEQCTIDCGRFLDIHKTNIYKSSQMIKVIGNLLCGVKEGDSFLFLDMWNPTLLQLAYIRDLMDYPFKIYGILHAGVYDPWDFLSQTNVKHWGLQFEKSLVKAVDGIFVATSFHKDLIYSNLGLFNGKLHITGLPFMWKDDFMGDSPSECLLDFVSRWKRTKEKIIAFPHRLDPEKNVEEFDLVSDKLIKEFSDWKIIKTDENYTDKKDFYETMNRCAIAVSTAWQETWGIAMQEAAMCGCIPLVPDRLSYREMYPMMFRYRNLSNHLRRTMLAVNSILNVNTSSTEDGYLFLKRLHKTRETLIDVGSKAIPNIMRMINAK